MPKLKEGTITFRKIDNRYMGKVRKLDGQFKYVYSTTYKGCVAKIRDFIAFRDRNLSDIKLYAWLKEWFDNYKVPNVKPSTLAVIEVCIRVHIKKGLPNKPIKDFNGLELQKFLIGIEKSRTRKNVHDVLGESFRDAFLNRLIDYNPMQAVRIPVHHRKRGTALSDEDLQTLFERTEQHKTGLYFRFLTFTGCRRNEALNVCWEDIEFDRKRIHVLGTKTESSDRYIPLFENVRDMLLTLGKEESGKIFVFRPDYVTHVFKEFCPNHKLHDLRHTFATKCLEFGVPMKVVQCWLGHSEMDTTANIYSHVTERLEEQEAEKLNRAFSSVELTAKLTANLTTNSLTTNLTTKKYD